MRLRRTVQCEKCPWKQGTNPHNIPNNYDPEKHKRLENTIAKGDDLVSVLKAMEDDELHIMTCHEAHSDPCLGWLINQLGAGNNVKLRMAYWHCENLGEVKLVGPQHKKFEDTLPK